MATALILDWHLLRRRESADGKLKSIDVDHALPCDAGDHVVRLQARVSGWAAGIDLLDDRTGVCWGCRRRVCRLEANAEQSVLDFAALLERVDDAASRFVDRNGIAGGLFVAGDRGDGGGETDQFATKIDERPAAGAPAELGVGLNQRAEVVERSAVVVGGAGRVVEVRAGGRLAGQVGDDAPTGRWFAVAVDCVGIADRDDELAFVELCGIAEGDWLEAGRFVGVRRSCPPAEAGSPGL